MMSSQESDLYSDGGADERIQHLLQPLQNANASIEYLNQYKAMKAFNQRLHALETLFADVYSKISKLELEITKHQETNQQATQEASNNLWDKFS